MRVRRTRLELDREKERRCEEEHQEKCKLQSSAIHGETGTMPRARSTATT
jgi:hypothetical protein